MKLVYRIVLHLAWVLSLLLAAWAVLFYFALTDRIDRETDDALEARAETAIKQFLSGRALPDSGSGNDGCLLRSIPDEYAAVRPQEVYTDERIYIPERDAREPVRVLRMLFRDGGGGWHELTVMAPAIEKNELTRALLRWVVSLYLVLLLLLLVVTAWVLHRTMRPLYALLRWLDDYTVGKPIFLDCYQQLRAVRMLAVWSGVSYAVCIALVYVLVVLLSRRAIDPVVQASERQKQFIGNASHEMQTPLAVCRNRLEMLVDDARTLTGEQLAEIAKVQRTLGHLVRLNRSLLLLSKIENGQFPETGPVDVNALVRRTAGELEEIYAYRGMRCTVSDRGRLVVRMNPSLAESVVGNLLKNAFVHGDVPGEVAVEIAPDALRVSNGGAAGPLDAGHIFDRFYQGTKKEGSTGLGLAIVEAVCRLYGLRAEYAYAAGRHCFSILFPEGCRLPPE